MPKIKTNLYLTSITFFCLFFSAMTYANESSTVVRAALDIGSGGTVLRVAEVDLQKNKIVKVLETKNYAVPYQEQLSNDKNGNFNRQIMDQGIEVIKDAKVIADKYHAEKVIAVATAAFRKAHNAENYIAEIKETTGVEVNVINQDLEGELAFQAVVADYGFDPTQLVVWDVGGGSLQLTTLNQQGKYDIYRGEEASIPFRTYVIESVKKQDPKSVSTPNPHNTEELLKAQLSAIRLTKRVDQLFKDKIQQPSVEVVGVGKILGLQVPKMINNDTVSLDQMIGAVANLVDKTDIEVGGGEFANVYVTNSILVLGFMEGLNIQKMHLADINPADGAFFYSPFWQSTTLTPPSKLHSIQESQPQFKQPYKQPDQQQNACTYDTAH